MTHHDDHTNPHQAPPAAQASSPSQTSSRWDYETIHPETYQPPPAAQETLNQYLERHVGLGLVLVAVMVVIPFATTVYGWVYNDGADTMASAARLVQFESQLAHLGTTLDTVAVRHEAEAKRIEAKVDEYWNSVAVRGSYPAVVEQRFLRVEANVAVFEKRLEGMDAKLNKIYERVNQRP